MDIIEEKETERCCNTLFSWLFDWIRVGGYQEESFESRLSYQNAGSIP